MSKPKRAKNRPSVALVHIAQVLHLTPEQANDLTKQVCRLIDYPPLDLYHVRLLLAKHVSRYARLDPDANRAALIADGLARIVAGEAALQVAEALGLTPIRARQLLDETVQQIEDRGIRFVPTPKAIALYVVARKRVLRPLVSRGQHGLAQYMAGDRWWGPPASTSQSLPGHLSGSLRPSSEFEQLYGDWESD